MKTKKIFYGVLFVFILLLIFRVFMVAFSEKRSEIKERPIPVTVSQPKMSTIAQKIALIGDVKGETEVQVRPKTTGRIEEIYVNEGDVVRKGDRMVSYLAGITRSNPVYEDLVTFAPVSGIVGIKNIKQGEQVTSSMGTINPVFSIFQINRVKIYASVPEKYVPEITPGLIAKIKFDSYPDKEFEGRISYVRPVLDLNTRTAQIEILVDNPQHLIRPGMFARIELALKHKKEAMIIPLDAMLEDVSQYVLIAEGNRAIKKDLQTGIRDNDWIEVVSGLALSDKIIVVGQRMAKAGSVIEVKSSD